MFSFNFPFGFAMSQNIQSLESSVGRDFVLYTQRLENDRDDEDDSSPEEEGCTLWPQRRFRLYFSPNNFRVARVVRWRSWSTGPFAPRLLWNLGFLMDRNVIVGDKVVLHRPKCKGHGKTAVIVQQLSAGKYKVQLTGDDNLQFVTVTAAQIRRVPHEYPVNRMNVHGGGILVDPQTNVQISLEWIDPPTPVIDLYPSVVACVCPICRAHIPPRQAFDDDHQQVVVSSSTPHECPVCFHKQPCRTLLPCRHVICPTCWGTWRRTAGSRIPRDIGEPRVPDLSQRRDQNYATLRATLPAHVMNGTAVAGRRRRANDRRRPHYEEEENDNDELERFHDQALSIVATCLAAAHDGDEARGLPALWETWRTVGIHLFCIDGPFTYFLNRVQCMASVEIVARVVEERAHEIAAGMVLYYGADDVHANVKADAHVHYLQALTCNRMGELYEELCCYRSAVHWYERGVHYATLLRGAPHHPKQAETASKLYNALGLAQKRAGFLTAAWQSYSTSLEILHTPETQRNLQILKREMDEWTGTSGKITPEC